MRNGWLVEDPSPVPFAPKELSDCDVKYPEDEDEGMEEVVLLLQLELPAEAVSLGKSAWMMVTICCFPCSSLMCCSRLPASLNPMEHC